MIGASYALRAVGDVSAPVLTWLSPIGWYQGMHAFSGVRWWPALLLLGATALALLAAALLLQRRDIGACGSPVWPTAPSATTWRSSSATRRRPPS